MCIIPLIDSASLPPVSECYPKSIRPTPMASIENGINRGLYRPIYRPKLFISHSGPCSLQGVARTGVGGGGGKSCKCRPKCRGHGLWNFPCYIYVIASCIPAYFSVFLCISAFIHTAEYAT